MANDANATNKKIPAGTNLEPELDALIEQFRTEEQRPKSQMIERLLRTHPRVEAVLGSVTAAAQPETASVSG